MQIFLGGISFCAIVSAYYLLLRAIRADEGSTIHHPPPRVTWILWYLVDVALVAGAQGFSRWPLVAYAVGSFLIASYAIKHDRSGWHQESLQVLALGGAAFAAWYVTEGAVAATFLVAAASVGAVTLCKDLWRELRTPGFAAWILFWVGGLAGLLAPTSWSASKVIVLGGFFVIQSLVLALAIRQRRRARRFALYVLTPEHEPAAKSTKEVPLEGEPFRLAA